MSKTRQLLRKVLESLDHPLRWSDGVNRSLENLVIALAPGRFISVGLVDGIRLLTRGQLPHERLTENLESGSPEDRP